MMISSRICPGITRTMKLCPLLLAFALFTWGAAQDIPLEPVPTEAPMTSVVPPPPPPTEAPMTTGAPLTSEVPPADPLAMQGVEEGQMYEMESNPFRVEYEDPRGIISVIAGNGVTVKRLVYYGDGVQRGLFHNGYDAIGFNNGAIFSTGDIKQAMDGVDDSDLQEPGYEPLSDLLRVGETSSSAPPTRSVFQSSTCLARTSTRPREAPIPRMSWRCS
jgi:hypothetical protein